LEEQLKELSNRVLNQEKRIEELQQKITELGNYIIQLSISKQSNPKFPYYEFIVENQIPTNKKVKIEVMFSLLSHRVFEGGLPNHFNRKEIEDIPSSLLYSDSLPTYQQVEEVIMNILDTESNEIPYRLIRSMKNQGIQPEFCDFLLSQVNAENYSMEDE
jgi:hypothetical protein